MLFEEFQLKNACKYVDARILKLNNEPSKDNRRIGILESQRADLLRWSEWINRNHHFETPILSVESCDLYEPSAALKHFWIGFFFEKTHVPFNIVTSYFLQEFDLEIFKKTCSTLIQRHEILRTNAVFSEDSGTVKQRVLPAIDPDSQIIMIDISAEKEKASILEQYLETSRKHIFTYTDKPLFYFTVIKYDEHTHHIIFNISHAIFDELSKDIFETEFRTVYAAYSRGEDHLLEPPVAQYKDFCNWERNLHRGNLSEIFGTYWFSKTKERFPKQNLSTYVNKSYLKDFSYRESLKKRIAPYLKNDDDATISAFYGTVSKAERTQAKSYRFTLDSDTFIRFNSLCRERMISAYPIIVAALNVLIYKKTSIRDVVLAANTAIRDKIELQKMIGFFVNNVLIRNHVDGNKTFDELLTDAVTSISLASYFKYYTLSRLLDDMDIPFNTINTIFLNMLPAQSNVVLEDLCEKHDDNTILGYFDIDLHIKRYANTIQFLCCYDFSVYSKEEITTLFDQFNFLLKKCINNPFMVMDEISLFEHLQQNP